MTPASPAEAGAPELCIVCGAAPRTRFRLNGAVRLRQCPRCLLGWWAWPPFDPGSFYDEEYFQGAAASKGYDDYAALEAGVARTARTRLKRIGKYLARAPRADSRAPTPGPSQTKAAAIGRWAPRLLELGCGTGVFLAEAHRAGWQVQGVEVSAYAAERARARGLDVQTAAVDDLDRGHRARPSAAFDCVALWDVLEHLRDPAGAICAAARALRPGGILALSTGDVTSLCARLCGPGWHLFNIPEHLFFFSPASLRKLLRNAGCRIVGTQREVNWVPAAYIAERLRKSGGAFGRIAGVSAAIAGRLFGDLRRWVIPATLGDVLGVYAVREA